MNEDHNPQDVINRFQKRQQTGPRMFIFGALALIFVFVGVIIIWQWISNPDSSLLSIFASDTPTITVTITSTGTASPTVTNSPIPPTLTPTITTSPTITPTPTIDGPFFYTVQEGDSLFSIAERFGVDVNRLMEVNELDFDSVIVLGQSLLIPDPNEDAPTPTPLPDNLFPGTIIQYRIQVGDTLTSIAIFFNSTEEAILEENEEIENANEIFVGQLINVPVNLVTPAPTGTDSPAGTPGSIITLTPSFSQTPTP